jgi:ubiquinone/menaquinone biosynthesis C-methylase UbiE
MSLPPAAERNASEIAYWNGEAGRRWLERQVQQDALLAPIGELLLERAAARAGEAVLDIGCGCGTSSLALAARVVPGGQVLAVDVSAPMLGRARERAPQDLPLEFVLADATVYRFAPARATLLFSRFGVMFFADPAESFANMRRGLTRAARVVLGCWRTPRENPWLMLPLQQAYRHVPRLPELGPEDPGPFSFADEPRVRSILERAGFAQIALEAVDLTLDLASGGGLAAAVEMTLRIGPTSRALEGQAPELQAAAAESIRTALAVHQQGAAVPLPAAIWVVTARNP